MTEKEKMLKGEYYNALDEELTNERIYIQKMMRKYNKTYPKQIKRRTKLLTKMIGKFEDSICIMPPVYFDYGRNTYIGKNFYANYDCIFLDVNKITIGDNVLLGPRVCLFTATHPLDAEERKSGLEYGKPITIGNDVWIGGNTVINPGVTIGDNVVIGSGSVVTKDIPSGVIACGNPCKIIRENKRMTEINDSINSLLL
ncbi:MAG: sugar O-acetyltransferase [Bacilli bacterium]|nr:sugar O-acetyltransferase [Bacilli bacterium]